MNSSATAAYHFDLDGTLFEVTDPFDRIVAEAANQAGASAVSPAAFSEALWDVIHAEADPLEAAAQRTMPDADATVFREAFVETEREATVAVPGAKRVLRTLQRDHPIGIITNGIGSLQREKLASVDLERYVDDVVISGEVGVGKPDPEIYHIAAERLPAGSRTFVADTYDRDLRPAEALGWETVLVGTTESADEAVTLVASVGGLLD